MIDIVYSYLRGLFSYFEGCVFATNYWPTQIFATDKWLKENK